MSVHLLQRVRPALLVLGVALAAGAAALANALLTFSGAPGSALAVAVRTRVSGWRRRQAAAGFGVALLLALTAGPAVAAPPSNDNFASATVASSLPYQDSGFSNITDATVESGEQKGSCAASLGVSVWYRFSPTNTTTVVASVTTFSGPTQSFDAVLTVWTGSTLGSLSEVACNSGPYFANVFNAGASLTLTAGTTYHFQVNGAAASTGGFVFRLAEPPPNDHFAAATALSLPFSGTGTLYGATTESAEPRPSGCNFANHTVWYRFTATRNTRVWMDNFPNGSATAFAVWSGTSLASLTPVTCVEPNQFFFVNQSFLVTAGTTYYVQVGWWCCTPSTFNLNLRTYTLSVARTGSGSGTVTSTGGTWTLQPNSLNCGSVCSLDFLRGSLMTLTATPDTGSVFTGWTLSGANQTCSGTGQCSFGLSGDITATATFVADTTPPTVTGTPDRDPNANLWYDADVTIDWSASDPAPSSGTAPDPPDTVASTEGTHVYRSGPSCDPAGNCGFGALVLSIDKSAPTVTANVSPSPNAAGWNNSEATVTYTCADAVSGVEAGTCSRTDILGVEGSTTVAGPTARDLAGNTGVLNPPLVVRVDTNAPAVTLSGVSDGATYLAGSVPTPACAATDAVSGVAVAPTLSVSGGSFDAPGVHTATCSGAADVAGNTSATVSSTYRVNRPPAAGAGGPYTVDEGSTATLAGSGTDPDGDRLTFTWSPATDLDDPTAEDPVYTGTDDSQTTLTLTVVDAHGASASDSTTVTVRNVAPTITRIEVPVDPVRIDAAVVLQATFADPGAQDSHCWEVQWDDGGHSTGCGPVSASHVYSAPGIYRPRVTVTDDDGGSATQASTAYVVVYDPTGGFVTGSGRINSPPGAYMADSTLSGPASFGFVARYPKGATTPNGRADFEFNAAGLELRSTSLKWMVVSGPKVLIKGLATINGRGDYEFLVSAVDGQVSGGGGLDRLRVKIVDRVTDSVVYDNQAGADDGAAANTVLDAGSIVIHR